MGPLHDKIAMDFCHSMKEIAMFKFMFKNAAKKEEVVATFISTIRKVTITTKVYKKRELFAMK